MWRTVTLSLFLLFFSALLLFCVCVLFRWFACKCNHLYNIHTTCIYNFFYCCSCFSPSSFSCYNLAHIFILSLSSFLLLTSLFLNAIFTAKFLIVLNSYIFFFSQWNFVCAYVFVHIYLTREGERPKKRKNYEKKMKQHRLRWEKTEWI